MAPADDDLIIREGTAIVKYAQRHDGWVVQMVGPDGSVNEQLDPPFDTEEEARLAFAEHMRATGYAQVH